MGPSFSNDVERVKRLKAFWEGGDERLPFWRLDAVDDERFFAALAASKIVGQPVAHHAVRIDEKGGFAHTITQALLRLRSTPPTRHPHGLAATEGRRR